MFIVDISDPSVFLDYYPFSPNNDVFLRQI